MNDLPPDLPRLRTLEVYLDMQLQAVRQAIADAEKTQPAPAPALATEGWVLQRIRGARDRPVIWLHRARCHLATGTSLSRAEAELALGEPGVRPCTDCHPERGLTPAST